MQDRQLARMAEVVRKREKEKQVSQLFTDPNPTPFFSDFKDAKKIFILLL
jgi:hypothetical protein